MKLVRRISAVVLGAMLLLGACGGDSFDRDELIQELVDESGGIVDETQASCIVDGMIEEFGEDKLNSNDDPTDEEQAKVLDLTLECVG